MMGRLGHVDRWLSEWLDEALPESRRAAVQRHLASCPRCRVRADLLRETVRCLRSLEAVAPPPGFVPRVRARIESLGVAGPAAAPRHPAGRLRDALSRRRWRPAAAAGLLLLLVWAATRFPGGGSGPVAGRGVSGPSPQAARGAPAAGEGADAGEAGSPQAQADPAATGAAAGEQVGELQPSTGRPAVDASGRLLIRTGRLDLVVPDVEAAYREAQSIAVRHGGFVESARLDGAGAVQTAALTLRVPDQRLEPAMDELAGLARLGSVAGRSIDAQDISQQYVDARARVETLRAQEARLRELASRSASLDDLLRVEQELWRVRGEIEQLEGQIRFWDRAVQLATVEVVLQGAAPRPAEPSGNLWERAGYAFLQSLHRLGIVGQDAVVLAASLLPYLAVPGAAAAGWFGWRRRRGTA